MSGCDQLERYTRVPEWRIRCPLRVIEIPKELQIRVLLHAQMES